MFRALSLIGGSSLLRSPSTLDCTRQSYRTASSKAKSPTIVKKGPRKTLKSSSSINASLGEKDGETKATKKRRGTRNIQTGSDVDNIAAKTAQKDGEHSAVKDEVKKRRLSRRVSIDIEDLGPNIRDEHAVQKYLKLAYKAKRRAIRSRIFDPKRVHIVSKSLCDDALERLKPSLEKHMDCDIIDLNPGPGMWSSTLHDFLKPRTHILMEPDAEVYEPFLKPLIDAEGSTYRLVAKSGLIWDCLHETLTPEYLPHQEAFEKEDSRLDQPNNTLLLVANLGFNPQKPYRGFSSITNLVLYQFLSAARAHSLFHKYGLIRMLLWVDEDAKGVMLPRNILGRKKAAVEAELTCSDINEVISASGSAPRLPRDHGLELESAVATLKRMKEANVTTPIARRGSIEIEASKILPGTHDSRIYFRDDSLSDLVELERRFAAGEFSMFLDTPEGRLAEDKIKNTGSPKSLVTPQWTRLLLLRARSKRLEKRGRVYKHADELRQLEEAYAAGEFHRFNAGEIEGYYGTGKVPVTKNYTPEYQQLWQLQNQQKLLKKKWNRISDVLSEFDNILLMQKQASSLEGASAEKLQREFEERYKAFMEKIATTDFGRGLDGQVGYTLDNRIAFNQDPPLLYWDRRRADPLKADVEEFYPKSDMALLDIQPRPLWPILRKNYPENYDVLEYILSTLLVAPRQSIRDGFQSLAPGAFEWLISECPSITDIEKGGNPHLDAMTVRCLNVDMYKEIVEAWVKWPFRPSRNEILSRMGSDIYNPDPVEIG